MAYLNAQQFDNMVQIKQILEQHRQDFSDQEIEAINLFCNNVHDVYVADQEVKRKKLEWNRAYRATPEGTRKNRERSSANWKKMKAERDKKKQNQE